MSTLEYRFEDLAIDIDGKHGGAFTGIAFLVADTGGFWVSAICLTEPQNVRLLRSGSTLARELYMAIESELYQSADARDAWAEHLEEERENASTRARPDPLLMAATEYVMFGRRR